VLQLYFFVCNVPLVVDVLWTGGPLDLWWKLSYLWCTLGNIRFQKIWRADNVRTRSRYPVVSAPSQIHGECTIRIKSTETPLILIKSRGHGMCVSPMPNLEF
jgi:hypothetical protein